MLEFILSGALMLGFKQLYNHILDETNLASSILYDQWSTNFCRIRFSTNPLITFADIVPGCPKESVVWIDLPTVFMTLIIVLAVSTTAQFLSIIRKGMLERGGRRVRAGERAAKMKLLPFYKHWRAEAELLATNSVLNESRKRWLTITLNQMMLDKVELSSKQVVDDTPPDMEIKINQARYITQALYAAEVDLNIPATAMDVGQCEYDRFFDLESPQNRLGMLKQIIYDIQQTIPDEDILLQDRANRARAVRRNEANLHQTPQEPLWWSPTAPFFWFREYFYGYHGSGALAQG